MQFGKVCYHFTVSISFSHCTSVDSLAFFVFLNTIPNPSLSQQLSFSSFYCASCASFSFWLYPKKEIIKKKAKKEVRV